MDNLMGHSKTKTLSSFCDFIKIYTLNLSPKSLMLFEQAFKSIIFCHWFHLNLSITFKMENLISNAKWRLVIEKVSNIDMLHPTFAYFTQWTEYVQYNSQYYCLETLSSDETGHKTSSKRLTVLSIAPG